MQSVFSFSNTFVILAGSVGGTVCVCVYVCMLLWVMKYLYGGRGYDRTCNQILEAR